MWGTLYWQVASERERESFFDKSELSKRVVRFGIELTSLILSSGNDKSISQHDNLSHILPGRKGERGGDLNRMEEVTSVQL